MSPSNSVTVSELSLGIELEYDIVSVQQYYLAQKSLPVFKELKHFNIATDTDGLTRYIHSSWRA
jgi:gamma-glutamyl:cysteine ligase YbdK (ATP-grasp superfamily)